MATYTPVAYTTAANNTQIDFDVTFTFLRTTDVVVSVIDPSGNVLVDGSDYDAELQALNNGTFDMRVVAAGTLNTTQTPLASNHVISLKRNTDISQLATVFQDGASFRAADINALITQLFNKIQEVEVSSGEGIGLTDDLVAFDAENKPLRNLGTPTADNDAIRKIDIDSGIGPDITTVAGIASDVTAVVADQADIGVVSTNLSGADTIGTVAGSIANVNTVGGAIANVNAVAADEVDIGVVATDLSGSDTIGTVAGIASDVTTVAGINAAVSNVSSIAADVTAVNADEVDIGVVAADLSGTDTIGTVAGSIANVNTLAAQDSNITTLTQAANLTALQNAATNAAAAEAALEAFNRTYLGAYSADPSADGNGDPLTDGDLYYNTTSNNLKFYDAGNTVWVTLNNSVQVNAAATLGATGDVTFATGPSYQDFLMRDNSNPSQWVNVNPSTVKSALAIAAGDVSGLSTVATSNDYNDLTNLPNLGSAAAAATTDFLQPGDVVDNLTSTSTTAPLSAAQGKVLQDEKAASGFAIAMSIVF